MLIRAGEPGTEPLDELGRGGAELARPALATPYPRVLDVDMLPAVALGSSPIPRRIADISQAGQILQLVRRREGAAMPGLLAAPVFELALPAAELGAYHVAHALLEGEFLRFYPDGMTSPGIVFPVEDAAALRRIAASLLPDPYAPYGSPVTR
jgi:hypothetical protein